MRMGQRPARPAMVLTWLELGRIAGKVARAVGERWAPDLLRAYILRLARSYPVAMAKETSILERGLVDAGHLEAMLVGRVLSREAQRAYEDYLRLRGALDWLLDLDPANELAISMVGSDVRRAEKGLLELLRGR